MTGMSLAEIREVLCSQVGRSVAIRARRGGAESTRTITLRRMA